MNEWMNEWKYACARACVRVYIVHWCKYMYACDPKHEIQSLPFISMGEEKVL